MKRLKKKIYLEHSFFSKLFDILFPINRSIVGEGYKKSLSILSNYIDFKLHKFPLKLYNSILFFAEALIPKSDIFSFI